MKLIVGLGNPGARYLFSRHNYGFMVLEKLAGDFDIPVGMSKFNSLYGKGLIKGIPVVMAKPQTFMNLSGEAVERFLHFFKIDPGDLIVIHDDLDLPFGHMRIKRGGGDGGHRGIRSIIEHIDSPDFVRIRMGIGKPPVREAAEGYVLERFAEGEMKQLPEFVTRGSQAVVEVVSSGTQVAMNTFNAKVTNNLGKEV